MRNRTHDEGAPTGNAAVEELEAAFDEVLARVEAGATLAVTRGGLTVAGLRPPAGSRR